MLLHLFVSLLLLSCVCEAQELIPAYTTCYTPTQRGEIKFASTLAKQINGRVIDAIVLDRVNGSFTCGGSPSYWGCSGNVLTTEILADATRIAPSSTADSARLKITGNQYSLSWPPTSTFFTSLNNSLPFLTNFTFSNTTTYSMRLMETANMDGNLCVKVSFRLYPYEVVSPSACFNSRIEPNPYGEFDISPPFENATISQLKLDYLSGSVGCSAGDITNWGCGNLNIGVYVLDKSHMLPSGSFPLIESGSSGAVTPDFNYDLTPTYASGIRFYTIANETTHSQSITFESKKKLKTKTAMVVAYAEVAFNISWPDNVGTTCTRVSASYSNWKLLGPVCVNSKSGSAAISVPQDLLGKRVTHFRFLFINGSVSCSNEAGTRWGCAGTGDGTGTFQILILRGSEIVVPDPSSDKFAIKKVNYFAFDKFNNDRQVTFATNTTLTNTMSAMHFEVYLGSSTDDNSGVTCFALYALLDECAENNGGCGERTCQSLGNGQPWCGCERGFNDTGGACVDINECTNGLHNCAEIGGYCTNTNGSFYCNCTTGFTGSVTCDNVNECGGVNNCNVHANCTDTIGSYYCNCTAGYYGDGFDCENINECNSTTYRHNCSNHATCADTDGSYNCTCFQGYDGNGFNCTEINECKEEIDNCSPNATCTNTDGGFYCNCTSGYTGDGVNCTNIDECKLGSGNGNNCSIHAACIDTDGWYSCNCSEGYSGNGFNCSNIDECDLRTHKCSLNATCADTDGGFSCSCDPGYSGDGFNCTNINECALGSGKGNNCSLNATCFDTEGWYNCNCTDGFSGDGFNCSNIDECSLGIHNCSLNATCSDTDGGFLCSCDLGYSGDGFNCTNTNECVLGSGNGNNCSLNATCIDTDGWYSCNCTEGFSGDGFNCSNIDECGLGTHKCSLNATCADTDGGFLCSCDPGYSGNGFNCTNDNECALGSGNGNNCSVNATCIDTNGGYQCNCTSGYEGDGFNCTNINECDDNICSPYATCHDTEGSFYCNCSVGYFDDGNNCTNVDECGKHTDDCSPFASCHDTDGSFYCNCSSGYYGDGKNCTNINECTEKTANCSAFAVCNDTQGSYNCTCIPGYFGNGTSCNNINECTDKTDKCSPFATCHDTEGGYNCNCSTGYVGDGFTCAELPGALNISVSEITRTSVLVQWQVENHTYPIIKYTLQQSLDGTNWAIIYESTELSLRVAGLTEGTTYHFRVSATNEAGTGNYSTTIVTTAPLTVPSQPKLITLVDNSRDAIILSWTAPEDNGGRPITRSLIQHSHDSVTWVNISVNSNQTSYSIRRLVANSAYLIKVSSANIIGFSAYSEIANLSTLQESCGDNVCDNITYYIETCSSCASDCGVCVIPSCSPICMNGGTCNKGVCNCPKGWNGPACSFSDTSVLPIDIVPNTTNPNVDIGVSDTISFGLSFEDIQEVFPNGTVLISYPLQMQNFTLLGRPQTMDDGSNATLYEYNATLPNDALVSIRLLVVTSATTVQFADRDIDIGTNGIKYSMEVANWAFQSLRNKLVIHVKTDAESRNGQSSCTNTQVNPGDSLQWLKLYFNGVTLYGTFLEVALIDDNVKTISFNFDTITSVVAITVPHFWDYVEFDPSFQVLLDSDNPTQAQCDSAIDDDDKGVSSKTIGIVVGVVAGLALLGAIAGLIFLKNKKQQRNKRLSVNFGHADIPMEPMGSSVNDSSLYSNNEKSNPMYVEQ